MGWCYFIGRGRLIVVLTWLLGFPLLGWLGVCLCCVVCHCVLLCTILISLVTVKGKGSFLWKRVPCFRAVREKSISS